MPSFSLILLFPLNCILIQIYIFTIHPLFVYSLTFQQMQVQRSSLKLTRLLLQESLVDNQAQKDKALESIQAVAKKSTTIEENVDKVQTGGQLAAKPEIFTLKYSVYLQKYKPKDNIQPNNDLYKYRESVFFKNIKTINDNNAKPKTSFLMELNLFTDIDQQQFKSQYLKFSIPQAEIKLAQEQADKIKDANNGKIVYSIPRRINVDWSCKASPIISQGSCGATFAISVLQSIEITFKIYNQTASYLSIQQILSCSSDKKDGCKTGYFTAVFDYVEKKGVGQNPSYYYDIKARQMGIISNCNIAVVGSTAYKKYKLFIKDSKRVKYGDCKQLVNILVSRALAVGIAGQKLQFYGSGKFTTSSQKINHAVTLVGYSPEKGYKIKNSWQRSWGLDGYAYVSERVGICNYAYYPILNKETDKVPFCVQGK